MNRQALALAVSLVVGACGSSAILERSAPERPAWVELTPAARDSLYFVGVCSDLLAYQEALRCARGEALTDVAAWVGARFSSYVFTEQTEETRSSSTLAYFDSDLFLADVRRSDSYYEVRQEDWGRSYYVSVLLAYPLSRAEAEKARIEQTTVQSERLVGNAPMFVDALASEGRWGDAMRAFLRTVQEVVVPHNLQRSEHAARLATVAEELVTPLALSARIAESDPKTGAKVEAEATYKRRPAAGVPLHCLSGAEKVRIETGSDGRAACETVAPAAGETTNITVRPDITDYLTALPDGASGLAGVIGELLDRAVVLEAGVPLDLAIVLAGGGACELAMQTLERELIGAGVRTASVGRDLPRLDVSCRVEDGESSGQLFTATASAELALKAGEELRRETLDPVRGLGANIGAAREEAQVRLGESLSAAALKLLSDIDGHKKM